MLIIFLLRSVFQQIRHAVFWPSLLALLIALVFSIYDKTLFLEIVSNINDKILNNFSWLFSTATILLLLISIIIPFSPLGKIRIGGENAKPILNRWRWFSIILCTTIATGILFWGMAEPIFHYIKPPESLGIEPNSKAAAVFSMSTMYLHWSFTPYAIYVVPSLLFALAFFNKGYDYSISSTLFPLLGKNQNGLLSQGLDSIALFSLVAGMSASLGAGLLTLAGGINLILGTETNFLLLAIICSAVVGVFLLSAVSGLLKGVRILSDWNMRVFIVLILIFISFIPLQEIVILNLQGLKLYFTDFIGKSTFTGDVAGDVWPKKWTIFNWANWMAWAPVTALFLGNLGYGRTVKEFMLFTWILPALFAILWMSVFSGSALIYQDLSIIDLASKLQESGPESIIYAVIEYFPGGNFIAMLFIIAVFISFVTAADSTTIAMGALSTSGLTPENPDPPTAIKILWGVLVGIMALIMVGYAGIDGIKMISTLGGLPIAFYMIAICIAAMVYIYKKLSSG